MKEFWIYTALRVGLFIGAFCLVAAVWLLLADTVDVLWAIVIAFLISGVASYVLLQRQRAAFAARVEGRAQRISQKYEQMRAREDTDD